MGAKLQGDLYWLELYTFDSIPGIHKGRYLCSFLSLT